MRCSTLAVVLSFVGALGSCGDNVHRGAPTDGGPLPDVPVDASIDAPDATPIDAPIDGPTCTPPADQPVVASVATGELVIGPTQQANFVPVSYDDAQSILFTSLREREPSPQYGGVYCLLAQGSGSAGSGSGSGSATVPGVECRRSGVGTDLGLGTITVGWTVVTFSSGVSVQRGLVSTTTNPAEIQLGSAVDLSTSFVLLNGELAGGGGWGNNDFARATLGWGSGSGAGSAWESLGSDVLEIRNNIPNSQVTWQVVTMAEASVQSGSAYLGSADLTTTVAIGSASPDSLVLGTYYTDNASGISASALMVQATLSGSGVTFTRNAAGSGSASANIGWQVIELPFYTKTMTTAFGSGDTMKTEAVMGLVGSNSVVLASGQAVLGQSGGSTTYQGSGSTADTLGEATAELTASDGQVTLERDGSDASASFTWTAIDFGSNRCP